MTQLPTPAHRDFRGYGPHPPHAHWPDGARVAVSLVLNVEEGSERAISRGDLVNEGVYDMIEFIEATPTQLWNRISTTARAPATGASHGCSSTTARRAP